MPDFYSVKAVADYLGVEYKTVWRLIRSGQLPAVRIGRVYRIRPQDLEIYLQTRSAVVLPHSASEGEQILCGYCGRVIPDIDLGGGVCTHPQCDEWLCSVCWGQDLRYCRTHRPTAQERLAQAQAALARGEVDRVITSIQARQREQAFISRFEERIYGLAVLQHPLTRELLKVKDWGPFHSTSDESEQLLEILGVAFLERSLLAVTPVNSRSCFTIRPGELGRNSPRQGLVLEAQCISDLKAQAQEGLVTGPARLSTLLTALSTREGTAQRENLAWVVALAATNGWDNESAAYVAASPEGRSYRHRLLLPILVDLHASQVHYNIVDERIKGVVGLFSPAREAEEVLRLRRWIEEKLAAEHRTGLTLEEVVDELGLSAPFVQQTFQQMAQEPRYRFVADGNSGSMLIRNDL